MLVASMHRATRLRFGATNPGILDRIVRHCVPRPAIRIQNRFANGQMYVGVIGLASGYRIGHREQGLSTRVPLSGTALYNQVQRFRRL